MSQTFTSQLKPMSACLQAIANLKSQSSIDDTKIYTSKDFPDLWNNQDALVTSVPQGFSKVLLPFIIEGTVTTYISTAGPNTKVPVHSHNQGATARFIVSGSIVYKGTVLTEGDWIYLPDGANYEFEVGPLGVVILGWYPCCC